MSRAARGGIASDWTSPPQDSDLRVLSSVSRARAWTITGVAACALSVTLVHRQVLAALASTITASLGISDVEYGWLSSALAAAFLLGSLPAARMVERLGARNALAITVAATSIVIGLHSTVGGFWSLLPLRASMGLAAAPSFPAATKAIHRVLPFRDRARGVGLLYMGNSVGSALAPPIAVLLESLVGWRRTFFWVAVGGGVWLVAWLAVAFFGQSQTTLDPISNPPPPTRTPSPRHRRPTLDGSLRITAFELARHPGVLRGSVLVAAAAPITLLVLIWAAKYLTHDHHVPQADLGRFLWLPALMFGAGSLSFGELRSRSTRTRATARPPSTLVTLAAILALSVIAVPFAGGPSAAVAVAALAMGGAGGLYSLATSDMLAHAPRFAVPATSGMTTLVQSLVYIVLSPIIGKVVSHFGSYRWVLVGAGVWVAAGSTYWIVDATLRPAPTSPQDRRKHVDTQGSKP